MSTVKVPTAGAACPQCGAGLDRLVVGGVGDWATKVVCQECWYVWAMPAGHITTLVAIQYGIPEWAAAQADARSQAEFQRITLGGVPDPDFPGVPPAARWHLRRLAQVGQS